MSYADYATCLMLLMPLIFAMMFLFFFDADDDADVLSLRFCRRFDFRHVYCRRSAADYATIRLRRCFCRRPMLFIFACHYFAHVFFRLLPLRHDREARCHDFYNIILSSCYLFDLPLFA